MYDWFVCWIQCWTQNELWGEMIFLGLKHSMELYAMEALGAYSIAGAESSTPYVHVNEKWNTLLFLEEGELFPKKMSCCSLVSV